MSSIMLTAGSISALSFLLSAVCWIKAASVKHPNLIDLGVIGGVEEPRDWFWAYRRATTWNSRVAWLAASGARSSPLVAG
jgi:hypothetical protein